MLPYLGEMLTDNASKLDKQDASTDFMGAMDSHI